MADDDYIRFDEIEDVLASLDLLALLTPRVKQAPQLWKWVIMAAQSALQGAIVCALHDGVGVSVLDDKSARAVLKWHQTRIGRYPRRPRMAEFWVLLKRFCEKKDKREPRLSWLQARDVYRLHREFRNTFQHFQPMGWSIEKAGLPRIVGTAIDVTEFAMADRAVLYRLDDAQNERLKRMLARVREGLASAV